MKKLILLAAMLAMTLVSAVPALAQGASPEQGTVSGDQSSNPPETNDNGIRGTITNISGSVVLVEEDPSAPFQTTPPSSPSELGAKGFFTVTDETEITKQEDGKSIPAAFEDLEVGQIVEATYAGDAIAAIYPSQGNAESIVILEETTCMLPEGCDPGPSPYRNATFSFELAVECEPPADAEFLGLTSIESLMTTPLIDPDGDGLYTGDMNVPATSGGQGGPPEPLSLPVRIAQGPPTGFSGLGPEYRVIKDFGLVKAEDRTFEASVSFCDDDGSDNNNNNNGGAGSGSSSGSGMKLLPATGGAFPVALGAGALLITGGLLARRLAR